MSDNDPDSRLCRVMRRWDSRMNTAEIAKELMIHESEVLFALHFGLEHRRLKRAAEFLGANG